jgi:hypothetical protein
VTVAGQEEPEYEVGDVNRDGEVNIADVTTLVDTLLANSTVEYDAIADVYADDEVNIADVTALIDKLLAEN